jgi:uncharacterized membrane protein
MPSPSAWFVDFARGWLLCTALALLASCSPAAPNVAPWSLTDAGSIDASVSDAAAKQDGASYTNPDACASAQLTASDFGPTFMREQCAFCHSVALVGDARNGAPELVNFDTGDDIAARVTDIQADWHGHVLRIAHA